MRNPGLVRDGAVLVRTAISLRWATSPRRAPSRSSQAEKTHLGERVVLPGLVDSHTHLISSASRAAEYEQRIAGATYEEIARKGGGILSTVRALRRARPDALKRGRAPPCCNSPHMAPPR